VYLDWLWAIMRLPVRSSSWLPKEGEDLHYCGFPSSFGGTFAQGQNDPRETLLSVLRYLTLQFATAAWRAGELSTPVAPSRWDHGTSEAGAISLGRASITRGSRPPSVSRPVAAGDIADQRARQLASFLTATTPEGMPAPGPRSPLPSGPGTILPS
jgi:hypothetical protein